MVEDVQYEGDTTLVQRRYRIDTEGVQYGSITSSK